MTFEIIVPNRLRTAERSFSCSTPEREHPVFDNVSSCYGLQARNHMPDGTATIAGPGISKRDGFRFHPASEQTDYSNTLLEALAGLERRNTDPSLTCSPPSPSHPARTSCKRHGVSQQTWWRIVRGHGSRMCRHVCFIHMLGTCLQSVLAWPTW